MGAAVVVVTGVVVGARVVAGASVAATAATVATTAAGAGGEGVAGTSVVTSRASPTKTCPVLQRIVATWLVVFFDSEKATVALRGVAGKEERQ